MKKQLFMTMVLTIMALAMSAQSEYTILEDLTSSKIQNADFSADSPVTNTIRTYSKDMTDEGAGNGGVELFGQQPVTGWTATNPSDNIKMENRTDGADSRAAGVFAYESDANDNQATIGLGGDYYAPYYEDGLDLTGNVLGMVAVWTASVSYTQEVALPEGAYMLIMKVYNSAGSSAIQSSLYGFMTDDGREFKSDVLSYPVNTWYNDTIFIRLKADASGTISVGYTSNNYGSGKAPHLFIDKLSLYAIDPLPLDKAEIDANKKELLVLIDEAKELDVEWMDSWNVYKDEKATLDDVKAAIDNQKAINETGKTDLSAYFIKNAHFSLDTPIADGVTTYDYDMETRGVSLYSMQPVQGWIPSNTDNARAAGVYAVGSNAFLGDPRYLPPASMSDGSTEGKVLGFVCVWTASTYYYQNVTIPAGKYKLTISYYNSGGTGSISKNLMGFVSHDGKEYLGKATKFEEGKWLSETISFEFDEAVSGYFSMGYTSTNSGSGSMPHLFIDGISLVYSGLLDFDPSLFALKSAVETGEGYLDENFYEGLKQEFREIVEEGANLVSTQSVDVESNNKATDAINNKIKEVVESIEAYRQLKEFYDNELFAAESKYEGKFEALYNRLLTLDDGVAEALNDYNWTTAQIQEAMTSVTPIVIDETEKAWKATVASDEHLAYDLDLSPLFDELSYKYSTTAQSGVNVPDKTWTSTASTFKTQYGTAEVYNVSPFTVSKTLKDMPAGKYTITTKAFYRNSSNSENYINYNPDGAPEAFVFAGNAKTGIANQASFASSEPDAFVTSALVGDDQYVVSSQQAAHVIFEDDAYTEILQRSVKTVLLTDGDLIFGMMADKMNTASWVCWYSFSIAYNTIDEEGVNAELSGLIMKATEMLEDGCGNVEETISALSNAIDQGRESMSESDIDEKGKAVNSLKSAIEEGKNSVSLVNELSDMMASYMMMINTYGYYSSDETFPTLLSEIDGLGGYYDSNKQIQEFIKSLPEAWVVFVFNQDHEGEVSEENPLDVTGLIMNPDFETGNADFWSIVTEAENDKIGSNQGYQNNNIYINSENTDVCLNQFVEAWRGSGVALHDGDICQTMLTALPSGSYRLEVDAFAENKVTLPDSIVGVSLYVTIAGRTYSVEIATPGDSDEPDRYAINFTADGQSKPTVGINVSGTNASWLAADNFRLLYTGPATMKGDVNGDGKVDINDVVCVINHMAGTATWPNANVNGDTKEDGSEIVDVNDVVAIINEMAEI